MLAVKCQVSTYGFSTSKFQFSAGMQLRHFSVVLLVTVKRTAPYVHAVIITLAFWVTIAI